MKVLLPVQERWCEIQNRRCKHVGNSFTLLSVPSSIRGGHTPASISQLTSKSLKESLPLLRFTQYSGTGSLPCTQTNTFAIKILIPPVNVQQLMRVFCSTLKCLSLRPLNYISRTLNPILFFFFKQPIQGNVSRVRGKCMDSSLQEGHRQHKMVCTVSDTGKASLFSLLLHCVCESVCLCVSVHPPGWSPHLISSIKVSTG